MKWFGGGAGRKNSGVTKNKNNRSNNRNAASAAASSDRDSSSRNHGVSSGSLGYNNSNNNIFSGGRDPSLSQDLLKQEKNDLRQHGGPIMERLIFCLAKILPCSEALIGRLIWVCIWGWKLAPVTLYESFRRQYDNQDDDVGNNDVTNTDQQHTRTTNNNTDAGGGSGLGFHRYVSKWWQKTIAVPAALGFYYFLYDNIAQPLVYSVGCCKSDVVTFLAEMGVLCLHFISGLSMHLCEERNRRKQQEQDFERQYQFEMENHAFNNSNPNVLVGSKTNGTTNIPSVSVDGVMKDPIASGGTASSSSSSPTHANLQQKQRRGIWPFFGGRNNNNNNKETKSVVAAAAADDDDAAQTPLSSSGPIV
jgi:hypothetical protein